MPVKRGPNLELVVLFPLGGALEAIELSLENALETLLGEIEGVEDLWIVAANEAFFA